MCIFADNSRDVCSACLLGVASRDLIHMIGIVKYQTLTSSLVPICQRTWLTGSLTGNLEQSCPLQDPGAPTLPKEALCGAMLGEVKKAAGLLR